jgi:hypothetical protein
LVFQLEERGSREYFGEAYDQYVVVALDFIPWMVTKKMNDSWCSLQKNPKNNDWI